MNIYTTARTLQSVELTLCVQQVGGTNHGRILECNEILERAAHRSSDGLTAAAVTARPARATPANQLLNGQPNVPLLSPSVPACTRSSSPSYRVVVLVVVVVVVEFISRE